MIAIIMLIIYNNSKSLNEYSASCSYNLPLSVAHVKLEIVGDPKIRVFTIVTVSMKNVLCYYHTRQGTCEVYT